MRQQVSQNQKSSLIVPLPKKGDLSQTGNWRGISLMPHITKLFDKLLLFRIRDAIDRFLNPAQNGFREARGTVHHIMSLSIIRDFTQTHHFPLHGCFVDFSKAFDSVKWESIVQQLLFWKAPKEFIQSVFNVMQGHVVAVRTSDSLTGPPIPVGVGVLQGDTLAPYLFIMVLDSVLRSLPEDECGILVSKPTPKMSKRQKQLICTQSEKRIGALAFADDVLLLAHSAPELQKLFSCFEEGALSVGLRVNMGKGKTERFFRNAAEGVVKNRAGEAIPVVNDYKYLGCHALDPEKDISRKRQLAWSSLLKLRNVWKSAATNHEKRQLFSVLVEPILSYGTFAFPLNKQQRNRLDSMHHKMLRFSLGIPSPYVAQLRGRRPVHTEELYGELPFFSSTLSQRRFTFLAHAAREHFEGRAVHHLISLFFFDIGSVYKPKKGSNRVTLQKAIVKDVAVEHIQEVQDIMLNRVKSRSTAHKILYSKQEEVLFTLFSRRLSRASPKGRG